jgi:hypothetical protein
VQLSLNNTAQLSVTPHYNAYDVVEAKSIKRISTNLQNKQAQISWICFSKKIQENQKVQASIESIPSITMQRQNTSTI